MMAAPHAWAEQTGAFDLDQAKTVMRRLGGDARAQAIFAMCPADAYRRDAPFYADWVKPRAVAEATCLAGPQACYQRCAEHSDSGACFGLARVFSDKQAELGQRYTEMLYALACDAGLGAGCTNRAASLRNAPLDTDAALHGDMAARETCEHRSFKIACTQGDAWGCAMLGQTYQNGEGVPVSVTQARYYFERACTINPNFASCDFAKQHLSEIDRVP